MASPARFSARSRAREDFEPELLRRTKTYLACRERRLAVSGELLAAWERFYRTCDRLIRCFAVRCGTPQPDLNDLVQQVWSELVRELGDFHYDPEHARFSTWLYCRVRNKAIDGLRRRGRCPTVTLLPRMVDKMPGRDADPADELARQWLREEVRRVLSELRQRVSERSYLVLHLRCIEGWSVQQVAARLNLTPAQVWSRQHQMKRKFRTLFQRHSARSRCGEE